MTSLREFQRSFRAALLGEADVPAEIRGGMPDAGARLDIYRNNVIANLTGALALTFPAVERLVGAEFFAAAAGRFIAAVPPASADLYEYGAEFAEFLAGFPPVHGLAYLPDVARLEWAVNRALHAPVVVPLSAGAVASIPAERHADLRFRPHPSLSLLRLSHAAHAIWQAVLTPEPEDRAARLAAIELAAGDDFLTVVRAPFGLDVFCLPPDGFRLAYALQQGCRLGDALDGIGEADASAVLGLSLTNGCWQACELAGPSQTSGVIEV
jgi:hypothetical protein